MDNERAHNAADHSADTFSQRRAMLAGLGGLAAGAFMARSAQAGPLNPPPGPIASTPGPEARIAVNSTNTPGDSNSLFRISQPGSYYLTDSIKAVAGKHGIEIFTSGVTLDLNGFDLFGGPGMGDFDGVRTSASGLTDIDIRNGSVRDWGGQGVNLDATTTLNCRIDRIRSSGNAGNGITAGAGSTVTGCTARVNEGNGISSTQDSVIAWNTCDKNGNEGNDAGIRVTGSDNRIEGNHCTDNGRGIQVLIGGNIIIKNTCSGNTVNWVIVAGNAYGPIVSTPSGAFVSGNSAAAALGSSDPNANFTF